MEPKTGSWFSAQLSRVFRNYLNAVSGGTKAQRAVKPADPRTPTVDCANIFPVRVCYHRRRNMYIKLLQS